MSYLCLFRFVNNSVANLWGMEAVYFIISGHFGKHCLSYHSPSFHIFNATSFFFFFLCVCTGPYIEMRLRLQASLAPTPNSWSVEGRIFRFPFKEGITIIKDVATTTKEVTTITKLCWAKVFFLNVESLFFFKSQLGIKLSETLTILLHFIGGVMSGPAGISIFFCPLHKFELHTGSQD